jgi:dihydroorotate dehydrogenase (NAD+) catalytic subunit
MTATDAIEFMLAGASCVSIGTAALVEPKVLNDTVNGLKNYLNSKK